MKRKIASTGPSKNFLSQIETPCVSLYVAYAILELVPIWLRVPIWSGTNRSTDQRTESSLQLILDHIETRPPIIGRQFIT